MSSNILVFPGEHLEQASAAGLDSAADFVVVRHLLTAHEMSGKDVRARAEMVRIIFNGLVPQVQSWWDRRSVLVNMPDRLASMTHLLGQPQIGLHIDERRDVGFIATTNISNEPRLFHAKRSTVPSMISPQDTIDQVARERHNRMLENTPVPEGEWVVLDPGDSGLFGALPYLAEHAADGDTCDVTLSFFRPREINHGPRRALD